MFGPVQTSHFGLWDIIPPPPRVPTSFSHIFSKILELSAEGLVGTRGWGGGMIF